MGRKSGYDFIIVFAIALGGFWAIESNVELPMDEPVKTEVVAEAETPKGTSEVEDKKKRYEDYFYHYLKQVEELEQDIWIYYEPFLASEGEPNPDKAQKEKASELFSRSVDIRLKVQALNPPDDYKDEHEAFLYGLSRFEYESMGIYFRMLSDGARPQDKDIAVYYQQLVDAQSMIPREL